MALDGGDPREDNAIKLAVKDDIRLPLNRPDRTRRQDAVARCVD